MNKLSHFNAADQGFRDLDELTNAKALVEALSRFTLTQEFTLDLRTSYVDYGPASYVVEHLVNQLGALPGDKVLRIDTVIDLGKPEHYFMLLFRGSTALTGTETDLSMLREKVIQHLSDHRLTLDVRIFGVDNSEAAKPLRSVDPLA